MNARTNDADKYSQIYGNPAWFMGCAVGADLIFSFARQGLQAALHLSTKREPKSVGQEVMMAGNRQ